MPASFVALIHWQRLRDRFETHFVPFAQFERDAAAGTLPDFSFIEPNFINGHADYHPAAGRSLVGHNFDIPIDSPSSILGGEALLERTITCPQEQYPHPTRPLRRVNLASSSIEAATGFLRSWCRRGWSKARYSTMSIGTHL